MGYGLGGLADYRDPLCGLYDETKMTRRINIKKLVLVLMLLPWPASGMHHASIKNVLLYKKVML